MKVLVLINELLLPPKEFKQQELETAAWKTEYDVYKNLEKMGHEVDYLAVFGDLDVIRRKLFEFKPHIVFNLLEEFNENVLFDQHITSYLELKKVPYTGCNPRGLTLARDKALSKKILSFHRIGVPKFFVFAKNQKVKDSKKYTYPLIVKSLIAEGSEGISQASVVKDFKSLKQRVEFIHKNLDTDAIAEEYIEGREFYVGVFGNKRLQVLPIWELDMDQLPDSSLKFATSKIKWDENYKKKYQIETKAAKNLSDKEKEKIIKVCKKAYKVLGLNGYARMDLRYSKEGKVYIIEANPNPGIAQGEDFPRSAQSLGMSYRDVLSRIISLGLSWHKNRS